MHLQDELGLPRVPVRERAWQATAADAVEELLLPHCRPKVYARDKAPNLCHLRLRKAQPDDKLKSITKSP